MYVGVLYHSERGYPDVDVYHKDGCAGEGSKKRCYREGMMIDVRESDLVLAEVKTYRPSDRLWSKYVME